MAFYDDDIVPAGAIRAMVRSPASDAVPMGLPQSRMQFAAPRIQSAAPDLPQPQFEQAPGIGDMINYGTRGIRDLYDRYNKPVTIKNLDDQLNELKKQRSEFEAALTKLGSARTAPYLPESRQMLGDDARYLAGIRGNESGYDDEAVNSTTNATGRYQFLPSTAQSLMNEHPELGLKMEDLKKPETQEALMKLYTDKSKSILEPILGRKPTMGELYMLHFLGHAGGPQVLGNLDEPIENTTSSAARTANPLMFKGIRTGRDLLARLEGKFGG